MFGKIRGRYREEGRGQEALMLVPVHTDRYRESSKLLKQDLAKSFPNAVISFKEISCGDSGRTDSGGISTVY